MNLADAIGKGLVPGENCCMTCGATEGLEKMGQDSYCTTCREEIKGHYRKNDEIKSRDEIEEEQIAYALMGGHGFLNAARLFCSKCPIYYDAAGLWWEWSFDTRTWVLADEVTVLNKFRRVLALAGDTTVRRANEVLRALQQIAREQAPEPLRPEWVQFGGEQINILTGATRESTSRTFSLNAIPWALGDSEETPRIDELFEAWVGEKHAQTLMELLAYCCYREYPLSFWFVLDGAGRNGKSSFLRLLTKYLGLHNVVSSDLDRLGNNPRFETFNLHAKLCVLMGETNCGLLKGTGLLKQLVGQDPIAYEPKGKAAFTAYSYAKIVIATNSLPSSDDTSDGFYRRWFIVDFPNQFPEGQDILSAIPDSEYRNLSRKIARILPALLSRGAFRHQESIDQRKERYIRASNPLELFLNENFVRDEESAVLSERVYTQYCRWLLSHKRRVVSRQEFGKALEAQGLSKYRGSYGGDQGTYVWGLRQLAGLAAFAYTSHSASIYGEVSKKPMQTVQMLQDPAPRNASNNDEFDPLEVEQLDYSSIVTNDDCSDDLA